VTILRNFTCSNILTTLVLSDYRRVIDLTASTSKQGVQLLVIVITIVRHLNLIIRLDFLTGIPIDSPNDKHPTPKRLMNRTQHHLILYDV